MDGQNSESNTVRCITCSRTVKNYLRTEFWSNISIHGQDIAISVCWILKFYSWFRFWPFHCPQHVILHWPTKFMQIGWSPTELWHHIDFYCATACNATHGIAFAILSVSLSVHPSVRCMYCDKTKWWTADILIPHVMAITLVFWHQQWLVGDGPFHVKYSPKVTHPFRKRPTLTDFHSITSEQ